MSSIGLDPVESANFADYVRRAPAMPEAEPWFTGSTLLSPIMGLATGAANLSYLAEEFATPILRPIAEGIDKEYGTSGAAWLDEQQRLSRAQIVRQQKISPATFGKAGDVIRGAVQFGTEAIAGGIAGTLVGAPLGGAALVTGLAEGLPRYRKLLEEVDPDTAKLAAGIEGVSAGLGAIIPFAGRTLLESALKSAFAMPYLNAWQRGLTGEVLENAGYHDMAEQYKVWDKETILTDAAMGLLFGAGTHIFHPGGTPLTRIPAGYGPSGEAQFTIAPRAQLAERKPTLADAALVDATARDREARAPGIPADEYTRDANAAAINKSINDLLEGNPVEVSGQIDAERANFVPDPHAQDARTKIDEVVREEMGPLPADQPGGGEPPAAPVDESGIVSPIDRTATPEEKVNQMVALSKDNAPAVDAFLTKLDNELGTTKSNSNFKDPEKILSKSQRPSILEEKPWFAVEHIRDAFRFKTVLDNLSQLPDILERVRAQGWEIVKADTAKVLAPKQWGFRIAAFDLRMPNGQIVEYYLPVREMEAAKDFGHQIFEKWRNRDLENLSNAEADQFRADVKTSYAHYDAAWKAYLARTGEGESAARASLMRAEAAAAGAGVKDSMRASAENLMPRDQAPAALREADQPPSSITSARPLSATETKGPLLSDAELMTGSIAENVPPVEPTPAPIAELPGAVHGKAAEVKIGDAYVAAHWAIVPAAELEATIASAENQARNRNRAAAAVQVGEIANKLDYKLLGESPIMDFGAPTLAADGRVVGGNGRLLAIKQAYKQGNGEGAYAEPLRGDLARYGLDNEAARGVKEPVLVRILEPGVDVRKAAIASNEGGAMKMSALEQAKVDGERLPDTRLLVASESGNLNMPANRELIQQWVREYPAGERNALLDADGALSAEGQTRLRNAILFKAYGDSATLTRLVESADPEIKNVGNALVRVAPLVAAARARIEAGAMHPLDLGKDLTSAVERYAQAKAEGRDVAEHASQRDVFGGELTPEAKTILSYIDKNSRSARKLADMIAGYYEKLRAAGNPQQVDMLSGAAIPTKGGLLEAAIGDQGKQSALERDAQASLLDNPGMQVPSATGEPVPARDAIAAADREIAQAGQAQDMLDAALNCDRKAA